MKRNDIQFELNLLASIMAFIVNAGIQFFVTPILTRSVGDEAYGFITVANDFTEYAGIFAVVLNSCSARFIGVEIHKGNHEKANNYFNSVIIGDFIICSIISILGMGVVVYFPSFLNISNHLISDVRKIFILTFFNYIWGILFSVFSVCTFVKNRLDIAAIRNIIAYFIKLAVVLILFSGIFEIKVYYINIAVLSSTIFLGLSNLRVTRKIMPEVKINLKKFKIKMIRELIKTGIWMSINNLSNVFVNNITVFLINVCLNASNAGFYSVSKTISNCANTLLYTIYGLFVPDFVKLYAKNEIKALSNYALKSMKLMSLCLMVPFMELCIYGKVFFTLWQSYRNASEIIELSNLLILAMMLLIIIVPVLPIAQLGMVTNKIKWQTINSLFVATISVISTYFTLRKTNLGLIGVNLTVLCIQGCKWLFFTPVYAAHVIKESKSLFFKENILILFKTLLLGIILKCITIIFGAHINSWPNLIGAVAINTIIGYGLAIILYLNKRERKELYNIVKNICLR